MQIPGVCLYQPGTAAQSPRFGASANGFLAHDFPLLPHRERV